MTLAHEDTSGPIDSLYRSLPDTGGGSPARSGRASSSRAELSLREMQDPSRLVALEYLHGRDKPVDNWLLEADPQCVFRRRVVPHDHHDRARADLRPTKGPDASRRSGVGVGVRSSFGLLVIALAVLFVTNAAVGAPLRGNDAVRIVTSVKFSGASGRGKFTFGGPFADAGSVKGTKKVSGARLTLVETLTGAEGTLRIQSGQGCKSSVGSWKILSGTGSYGGLTGGGRSSSPPACAGKTSSVRSIFTGTVIGDQPGSAPPAPEPPPTPAPRPQDGHYVGTNSNLTPVAFDVSLLGTSLRDFTSGQINVSCTPFYPLGGGGFSGGGAFPIAADGSFSWADPSFDAGTLDGIPAVGHSSIQGVVSSSGTASGTINEGLSWGIYFCDSGVVTWTATRTS